MIAGHEPCGVVAAVGTAVTDKEARIGKRVMDHHYDGCGNCKHCRAGWTQMCLEGPVVYGSGGHGGHAKYMKVPVLPLPDALSFVTGAAISCGTGTDWGALRRPWKTGMNALEGALRRYPGFPCNLRAVISRWMTKARDDSQSKGQMDPSDCGLWRLPLSGDRDFLILPMVDKPARDSH